MSHEDHGLEQDMIDLGGSSMIDPVRGSGDLQQGLTDRTEVAMTEEDTIEVRMTETLMQEEAGMKETSTREEDMTEMSEEEIEKAIPEEGMIETPVTQEALTTELVHPTTTTAPPKTEEMIVSPEEAALTVPPLETEASVLVGPQTVMTVS